MCGFDESTSCPEPEENTLTPEETRRAPGDTGTEAACPRSPYASSPFTGYYDTHAPKPKKEKRKPSKTPGKLRTRALALLLAAACLLGGIAIGSRGAESQKRQLEDLEAELRALEARLEGLDRSAPGAFTPLPAGEVLTPAQVYARNVASVVGITCGSTTLIGGQSVQTTVTGSGFFLSEDGYVVTNYHVVAEASSISVVTQDAEPHEASLVGRDATADMALLKVEGDHFQPVTLGSSSELAIGDMVVAIGNPLGELTFSLTAGVVSALDREVTLSGNVTMELIQTDCAINSGNSGGALFNLYGEVIGITNAKYSSSSVSSEASIDNIGFAIPIDQVRSIFESIITNGYIVKPYIGVTVSDVSTESQNYGLPQGAAVRSVTENGPAAEAGLQENDIITTVNGEAITGSNDLVKLVKAASAGDTLELTVYRQGQTVTLTLTVGEQKTDALPTQTVDETQQPQSQNPYDGQYGGQSNGQSGDSFGSWPFGFGFGG